MSSFGRSNLVCFFVVLSTACQGRLENTDYDSQTGGSGGDAGRGGRAGDGPLMTKLDGGSAQGGDTEGPGGANGGGGKPQADAGVSDAPLPSPSSWLFVRVNSHLVIEKSCDGKTWQKPSIETPTFLGTNEGDGFRQVNQAGDILIATGGGNEDNGGGLEKLYTSVDGLVWKARRTGLGDWLSGAGYLDTPTGPVWISGGGNGRRIYSRDKGSTWREGARGCTLRSVSSGGGRVVGFCDEGTVIGTPAAAGAADPVKWTMQAGNGDGWGRGAYGNGRFVAVWGGATATPGCKVLVDGADTWRPCDRPVAESVLFYDGWFYASIASIDGDARWSQDGLSWVKRPEPRWLDGGAQVAAANGIYVRSDFASLIAARVPVGVCP